MDRGAWQATVHGVKWRFLVDLNSMGLDTGMPLFDLLDEILKPYRSRGLETERTGLQLWLCLGIYNPYPGAERLRKLTNSFTSHGS